MFRRLAAVRKGPSMEIAATHKGTGFDALASVVAAQRLNPESICVLPERQNPNIRSFISLHINLFNVSRPKEIDVDRVTRPIKAFMNRPVHTLSPWKNPSKAAQLMAKHDIGRLPVVKDQQIIGIITRSDAMGLFSGLCPLNRHLDPAGNRN